MKIKALVAIFLAVIMCLCVIACQPIDSGNTDSGTNNGGSNNNPGDNQNNQQGNNDSSNDNKDDETPAEHGEMKMKFLKLGKSPCVIIRTENHTIVIDAAAEDQGSDIVEYLTEKKITTVDYLIITNFSKTCIGGVPALLREKSITVKNILEPDYVKDSNAYTSYRNAVAAVALTAQKIQDNATITVDDVEIKFLCPQKDYGSMADENDEGNSVVLSITHGSVKFLYTSRIAGDRVTEVITQISGNKYNLITVPNYGIYDAKYDSLFTATGATNAVIFASTKNPPEISTTAALETAKITYLVTRDGGVEVRSDGTAITQFKQ